MPQLALPDKVVAIDRALDTARIRHAFGGALALAYYAEPRATIDVDVNLFVPISRFGDVSAALGAVGVAAVADQDALARNGQCRLWWARTPVDLFCSANRRVSSA